MRSRATLTTLLAGAAGLTLALAAPTAASAHVGVASATSTAPGTVSVITFSLGHACDGSPTTSVAIDLPAPMSGVVPTAKAGWQIAAETDADGTTVTYTADEPLADGIRDTFDVQAYLPEGVDELVMPASQTCVEGGYAWDGSDADHPAPTLALTSAEPEAPTAAEAGIDATARGVGIAGLVVGAVGVLVATIATRRAQRAAR
ncbi:DUF1775 domain-containing protein [Arenivirga flava]|uniref:YncI copper-binding domain-containing protein n=1 Tax=Arenivirga flava TaxID=1930060 RepID=A0AA37UMN1_9MICO|nr:DUF1775 domain-containing protein [Arenivirga flava]GMA29292.1 hypothetical protein GCM10025874_25450 [Arenivirga flava]